MHCGDSKPRPRGLGADFEAVIAAARSGQPAAWDRLYRVFSPGVHGYLRMQGASEPEDLTSEVFLAVLKTWIAELKVISRTSVMESIRHTG